MIKAHAKLKKDFLVLKTLHNTIVAEREHLRKRNEALMVQTAALQREVDRLKVLKERVYRQLAVLEDQVCGRMNKAMIERSNALKTLYTLIEKMS